VCVCCCAALFICCACVTCCATAYTLRLCACLLLTTKLRFCKFCSALQTCAVVNCVLLAMLAAVRLLLLCNKNVYTVCVMLCAFAFVFCIVCFCVTLRCCTNLCSACIIAHFLNICYFFAHLLQIIFKAHCFPRLQFTSNARTVGACPTLCSVGLCSKIGKMYLLRCFLKMFLCTKVLLCSNTNCILKCCSQNSAA
jgi:hypothetical protein